MRPQPNISIATGPGKESVRVVSTSVLAYVRVTKRNKNNKIIKNFFIWLFLMKSFPSNGSKTNQTKAQKEHGGGFGHGGRKEFLASGSWNRCEHPHKTAPIEYFIPC